MIGAWRLLISNLNILDKRLLLSAGQFLDFDFPFLGAGAIWLRFHIRQLHRATGAGIARPAPGIVLAQPSLGICCPPGVIGAIGTFENITIEAHIKKPAYLIRLDQFWICGRLCEASCRKRLKPSMASRLRVLLCDTPQDTDSTTIDPGLCGRVPAFS